MKKLALVGLSLWVAFPLVLYFEGRAGAKGVKVKVLVQQIQEDLFNLDARLATVEAQSPVNLSSAVSQLRRDADAHGAALASISSWQQDTDLFLDEFLATFNENVSVANENVRIFNESMVIIDARLARIERAVFGIPLRSAEQEQIRPMRPYREGQ